jgi:hypothetical protein
VRHVRDKEDVCRLIRHLVAAAEGPDDAALGAGLKGSRWVVGRDENLEASLIQMGGEERGAEVFAEIGQDKSPSGESCGDRRCRETDALEGAYVACVGHSRVTLYHGPAWTDPGLLYEAGQRKRDGLSLISGEPPLSSLFAVVV